MMHNDSRDTWLSTVGQRMGLSRLDFDGEGFCHVSLNGELELTLHRPLPGESLLLFGCLAVGELAPAILRRMLSENRSAARMAAPVLSMSEEFSALELHLRLERPDHVGADAALAQLVDALEYWREQVRSTPAGAAPGMPHPSIGQGRRL